MDTACSLAPFVGRWAIRTATRPAVWPFLCDTVVDLGPGVDAGRVFLRVRTAGGAVLRGYTLTWCPVDAGIRLSGIECNGLGYDLTLVRLADADGRRSLAGSWTSLGAERTPPVAEGGWSAEEQERRVAHIAA